MKALDAVVGRARHRNAGFEEVVVVRIVRMNVRNSEGEEDAIALGI